MRKIAGWSIIGLGVALTIGITILFCTGSDQFILYLRGAIVIPFGVYYGIRLLVGEAGDAPQVRR